MTQPDLLPPTPKAPSCADCARQRVGPLSGFGYCGGPLGPEWLTAHQARQLRGPCGPDARMFLPIKKAA